METIAITVMERRYGNVNAAVIVMAEYIPLDIAKNTVLFKTIKMREISV